MRRCSAPCAGLVDHAEYLETVRGIRLLLEGKNKNLLQSLEAKMEALAAELRYEEAAVVRDQIRAIEKISESQKIVAPELGDVDVIGFFRMVDVIVSKVLFIRNGMMIGSRDFRMKDTTGESDSACMKGFMEQFYAKEIIPPREVVCSRLPEDAPVLADWLARKKGGKVIISAPRSGIRRRLVAMAEENAEFIAQSQQGGDAARVLGEIGERFGLKASPVTIGAFDISNIGGSEPVGGFVFWEDGGFRKDRYRHIRMDTVKGPDDYAMMKEMVRRTCESLEGNLPDLIIIDGGREHLDAARAALDPSALAHRSILSVAKDPDRVFLVDREEPVRIDESSPSSLLLRRIRDEVHRFTIRCHRKWRERKAFESGLDEIYGIGRKRRVALLARFGSIDAVRNASPEEIAGLQGFNRKTAERLLAALGRG